MAFAAIVRVTVADAVRQPATWLATGLGIALVLLTGLFGMFNFEVDDRIRMTATAGIAAATVDGLVLAAVLASLAVHAELADRTALTLFAKPVSRGAYLAGKALGVFLAAAASTLVVVGTHLAVMAVGRVTGFEFERHLWPDEPLTVPWSAILGAHALGLMHTAVIACLATALATRIALSANLVLCAGAFVAGHLIPGWGPIPALAAFNADDAVQGTGLALWPWYLPAAGLYSALFGAGCLLTGLAAFQRQDIR
ncbi:hypothetical protein LBMAG53_06030 [Planctomycetota bacterium]|nr:hypothetical protein LBMAG53_06030 [Planctomycetota bacterium]